MKVVIVASDEIYGRENQGSASFESRDGECVCEWDGEGVVYLFGGVDGVQRIVVELECVFGVGWRGW